MLRVVFSGVLLMTSFGTGPAQGTTQPSNAGLPHSTQPQTERDGEQAASQESYEALLERVKKGDPGVDFFQLRMAYAASPGYDPYDFRHMGDRQAMREAFGSQDYVNAMLLAKRIVADNYLDIESHRLMGILLKAAKMPREAELEESLVTNLLDSIKNTGDGTSPKTAFIVISLAEERAMLSLSVLGFKSAGRQSLVLEGGHRYDRIEAVDPRTSKTAVFYFDVTRLVERRK